MKIHEIFDNSEDDDTPNSFDKLRKTIDSVKTAVRGLPNVPIPKLIQLDITLDSDRFDFEKAWKKLSINGIRHGYEIEKQNVYPEKTHWPADKRIYRYIIKDKQNNRLSEWNKIAYDETTKLIIGSFQGDKAVIDTTTGRAITWAGGNIPQSYQLAIKDITTLNFEGNPIFTVGITHVYQAYYILDRETGQALNGPYAEIGYDEQTVRKKLTFCGRRRDRYFVIDPISQEATVMGFERLTYEKKGDEYIGVIGNDLYRIDSKTLEVSHIKELEKPYEEYLNDYF